MTFTNQLNIILNGLKSFSGKYFERRTCETAQNETRKVIRNMWIYAARLNNSTVASF